MKKKLVGLTAALGIAALASWIGTAEAARYCGPTFCEDRPLETQCACPPGTDRTGSPSSCGTYQGIGFGGCWYE